MSSLQLIFWTVVGLVLIGIVYLLGGTLVPFLIGAGLAFVMDPAVRWMVDRGVGRAYASAAATFLAIAVVLGLGALAVPILVEEVSRLISRLPELASDLTQWLQSVSQRHFGGMGMDDLASGGAIGRIFGSIGAVGQWFLSSVMTLFDLVLLIVLTPFVTFFLLKDWHTVLSEAKALLPQRSAPTLLDLGRRCNRQLAGFIRGQGLLCLTQAVIHAIGLRLIGLEFGVLIGVLTGLSAAVPVIGNATMFSIALLVAVLQFDATMPVALVVALYAASQLLETIVLAPLIVGGRIDLHPIWVMFALLVGGKLFGLVGALLALPAAAVAQVLVRFAVEQYRQSHLHQDV